MALQRRKAGRLSNMLGRRKKLQEIINLIPVPSSYLSLFTVLSVPAAQGFEDDWLSQGCVTTAEQTYRK